MNREDQLAEAWYGRVQLDCPVLPGTLCGEDEEPCALDRADELEHVAVLSVN